jgi:AcrR family transcriptional regulator
MTRPVRGVRTDGEATRARILEAAGELFAASGFAETTSKAVAARAGVDLASINYHFGSRNGLYQAVLTEAHRRLMDLADLEQVTRAPLPASEKLKLLIGHLVQKAADSSEDWHMAVLAAEVLAPSSHFEVLFRSEVPKKISVIKGILSEITGIPANDPALMRCLLSVAAPCLLLQIGRRGIPGPVQAILRMPHETVVEHLHRFAIAGLEAVGQDYARRARGRTKQTRSRPHK